jgi:hypothetical protein
MSGFLSTEGQFKRSLSINALVRRRRRKAVSVHGAQKHWQRALALLTGIDAPHNEAGFRGHIKPLTQAAAIGSGVEMPHQADNRTRWGRHNTLQDTVIQRRLYIFINHNVKSVCA